MYSQEEMSTLYGFLKSTGEGNLKKMLVGGKLTEAHFKILMKIIRSSNEADFSDCFAKNTMPKVKLNGPEMALKDGFWACCAEGFVNVGLLAKNKAA